MMSELILLPGGDVIEAHSANDPSILGLVDVTNGFRPTSPTTVYKVKGDSTSGVMGILFPSGEFMVKAQTNIGKTFKIEAVAEEPTWAETVWDGAAPAHEFEVVLDDGTRETRVEGSHGILLGDYETRRQVVRCATPMTEDRGKKRRKQSAHEVAEVLPQGTLTSLDPPSLRRAA